MSLDPRACGYLNFKGDKMLRALIVLIIMLLIGGAGLAWSIFSPLSPTVAMQIQAAHEVLDRARSQHLVRYNPAQNWRVLPFVDQSEDRKALFIATILPLIAEQNERVLIQRAKAKTAPVGSPQYNGLIHTYGLKSGTSRRVLLTHIDKIPVSLTLAQAAIESGWGTSRFTQMGFALFGERTYNMSIPGMVPKGATGFKVKRFHSTIGSIRSFMLTLNSHGAYRAFRARRAALRAQGLDPTGQDLAPYLGSYSEIGDDYIKRILSTIRTNNLDEFNDIAHVDHAQK